MAMLLARPASGITASSGAPSVDGEPIELARRRRLGRVVVPGHESLHRDMATSGSAGSGRPGPSASSSARSPGVLTPGAGDVCAAAGEPPWRLPGRDETAVPLPRARYPVASAGTRVAASGVPRPVTGSQPAVAG
jgi:hypothetical protein